MDDVCSFSQAIFYFLPDVSFLIFPQTQHIAYRILVKKQVIQYWKDLRRSVVLSG